MHVPDGTVWTGRYPVAPGSPPRAVVVRVRAQGWTRSTSTSSTRTAHRSALGRGSLPTALFARRFDRIF